MGCVGCGFKTKNLPESYEKKIAKIKKYLAFRQRNKCTYCGGIIEVKPDGIQICISCRKRKK